MRPTAQFQAMVASLLRTRPTSVTRDDLAKHKNNEIAFYVISRMVYTGTTLKSQTEPFSNQMMIEISKNADSLKVMLGDSASEYKRSTPVEYSVIQGKGMIHWDVIDRKQKRFKVVKLLSPDGCIQIKFIFPDQTTQAIYNVCELPENAY